MNRHRCKHRGFTLVEALIASVVLSVAVLAVTEAVVTGQMQAYDAVYAQRGLSASEQLMERVLALPYNDPGDALTIGPDDGETSAADFDNIDDYHGYSESTGELTDASGNALPDEFDDFSRSVTITNADVNVSGFSSNVVGLRIVVTTTDTAGREWSLTRFVAEPVEQTTTGSDDDSAGDDEDSGGGGGQGYGGDAGGGDDDDDGESDDDHDQGHGNDDHDRGHRDTDDDDDDDDRGRGRDRDRDRGRDRDRDRDDDRDRGRANNRDRGNDRGRGINRGGGNNRVRDNDRGRGNNRGRDRGRGRGRR